MSPNIFKNKKLEKVVLFEYYAPLAKKVQLAGTFNKWSPVGTELKKDPKGKWKISLKLPQGRYEYRYFVDGDWQNDQRPVECIPNAFGSWNCVVAVE
ncbi:MAG: isoamylase early set domain-containing protein [Candidatus Omnitrophica bacterium]|nr:isoamylase early set domain-containing protein [Candidatus Omnitrophota bacterium]